MNDVVKTAIDSGLDPIDAIRCATLNSAREIGVTNLGGIAPGYVADLVVLDSLHDMKVKAVIFEGKLVAKNGKLITEINDKSLI